MPIHNPCSRGCGGSVGIMASGVCTMCGRPAEGGPRPPTAEEKRSRGRGAEQEADYTAGIYAIDYVPTPEELSRAVCSAT